MEVRINIIKEKAINIEALRIVVVAELYMFWHMGKAGLNIIFRKRPLFIMIKSPDNINILTVEGKQLSMDEAEKILPDIKDEL